MEHISGGGCISRPSALHTIVMRNLLSFCFGLFSALLYLLARLVLALDRLIGRVRSLAVWEHIRHKLHAAGRYRLACALAAFVPFFLLPGALLTQPGLLVTANGRPLGLIESRDMLTTAVSEIEQSASTLSGHTYALPITLDAHPSSGTANQFLTGTELRDLLVNESGELDVLALISIDGAPAGLCRTTNDAQTLLDRVKAQYTTASDENTQFMQQVRVDRVIAETTLVSELGALYDYLSPRLDVTATRSVTYSEDIPFETVTRENDQLAQTYRETVQQGRPGEAVVTAEITTVDGQEHGRTVVERTVLSDAVTEIVEVGTRNIGIGTGEFQTPLTSYTFTSAFKWRWGRLHGGVDLAAPEGTPVYAADNGKVIFAGEGGGYGWYVILDHCNGFKTLYAHNTALLVSVGDVVDKGARIALSGNTGNSTGPHLHFEVMVNDEKVDPQQYVSIS